MDSPHFIFISYRRSDSISEAGRIYDSLAAHFGHERVFKDVFDIPYGVDFVTHLEQAVSQCQVLLAIVGNTWVEVAHPDGSRRLNDPEDFVRVEVASALERDILVIPVLVNGAPMPRSDQLPADLKPLARRNAAQVRHDPDYHDDMNRLIGIVRDHFNRIDPTAADSYPHKAAPPTRDRGGPTHEVSTLAILSGVNGLLSLLDPFLFGEGFDLVAVAFGGALAIACLAAAFGLYRLKPWAWPMALLCHLSAIPISIGLMVFYGVFEAGGGDVGFIILIPAISAVVVAALFRPRIRRRLG
ncbi:MAG: toll/interleukin-1 receptor domain-containing protein [Cyanobacteria bacterium P01_A01_bin.135]